MPKIKSHSGAKKRFKRTASGKWKYKQAGLRHLIAGSRPNHSRLHRRSKVLGKTQGEVLDRYLPYG